MKTNKTIIMLAFALNAMTAFPQDVTITNDNGSVSRIINLNPPLSPNCDTNAVIALSEVLGKADEQTRLAEFAKHDDADVRRLAVFRLLDLTLLKDIEDNDVDKLVRTVANRRFRVLSALSESIRDNNQEHLEAFAVLYWADERLMAVRHLENQTLLAEIAKDDVDERVRKAAEARLEELKGTDKTTKPSATCSP